RRPGVHVRYVDRAEAVGTPDLLIIPGTKMTRHDLAFLRERSLDQCIVALARCGGAVLGICGGYQMLGERIEDPDGIEGPAGEVPGLGLFPAVTYYAREKATTQVRGRVASPCGLLGSAGGQTFAAYEVLMGRTVVTGCAP